MSMNFGSGGTSPNAKCEICEAEVKPSEKLVVEKHTMHSKCFKCAFCDVKLSVGACAMEPYLLPRYGPLFFCTDHMLTPPAQKKEQIIKKGYKEKGKKRA
ncbi:hypothetical protein GPALN_006010 [Globodera pallida]|uniref:LIM zinc-binding domain-containing protein n=1 Tax=Globodera pallida TaxID=36090 RepID=A0A183BN40_GLOPA|nr:hypothetical protein GPALN_006010 [Globodera pallida]